MLSGDRAALYEKRAVSGISVAEEVLTAWEAAKDATDASWLVCTATWAATNLSRCAHVGKPEHLALLFLRVRRVCGSYDPAAKDRICLKAVGTNGYAELLEAFAEFDSDVLYGACVFYSVGGLRRRAGDSQSVAAASNEPCTTAFESRCLRRARRPAASSSFSRTSEPESLA